MAQNERRAFYPDNWGDIRRLTLERANYRCEACGVKHFAERYSARTKQPYIIYLQAAHKSQYQTWDAEAETVALCVACHRRFDRQFRRKKKGLNMFTPIGYARVLIAQEGQSKLVGMARSYADLRAIIAALPDDTLFEVLLEAHLCVVGNGYYVKLPGGDIQVENESGAAIDLWQIMREPE